MIHSMQLFVIQVADNFLSINFPEVFQISIYEINNRQCVLFLFVDITIDFEQIIKGNIFLLTNIICFLVYKSLVRWLDLLWKVTEIR